MLDWGYNDLENCKSHEIPTKIISNSDMGQDVITLLPTIQY